MNFVKCNVVEGKTILINLAAVEHIRARGEFTLQDPYEDFVKLFSLADKDHAN